MTIYYLDEASGSDAGTGLSWAQAKKTQTGLSALAITGGDEVRIAKNCEPLTRAGFTITSNTSNANLVLSGGATGNVPLLTSPNTAFTVATGCTTSTITDNTSGSTATGCTISVTSLQAINTRLAYKTITTTNASSCNRIVMLFKMISSTASVSQIKNGDLFNICLCSDTTGTVVVDTFPLAINTTSTTTLAVWRTQAFVKGSALGSSIQSIAIYSGNSPATNMQLYINELVATPTDPVVTLGDLVQFTTLKTWLPVVRVASDSTSITLLYNGQGAPQPSYLATLSAAPLVIMRPVIYPFQFGVTFPTDTVFNHDGTSSSSRITFRGGFNTSSNVQDGYTSYSTGVMPGANTSLGAPIIWSTPSTPTVTQYRFANFENLVAFGVSIWNPANGGTLQMPTSAYRSHTNCIIIGCYLQYATMDDNGAIEYYNCTFVRNYNASQRSSSSFIRTVAASTVFDNTSFIDTGYLASTTTYNVESSHTASASLTLTNSMFVAREASATSLYLTYHIGYQSGQTFNLDLSTVVFHGCQTYIRSNYFYVPNGTSPQKLNLSNVTLRGSGSQLFFYSDGSLTGLNTGGDTISTVELATQLGAYTQKSTIPVSYEPLKLSVSSSTISCSGLTIVGRVELDGCTVTTTGSSSCYGNLLFKNGSWTYTGSSSGSFSLDNGLCTGVTFINSTLTKISFSTRSSDVPIGNWHVFKKVTFVNNTGILPIFHNNVSYLVHNLLFESCTFPALTPTQLGLNPRYNYHAGAGHHPAHPYLKIVNPTGLSGGQGTTYVGPFGAYQVKSDIYRTNPTSLRYDPTIWNNTDGCVFPMMSALVAGGALVTLSVWVYQVGSCRSQIKIPAYTYSGQTTDLVSTLSATTGAWVNHTVSFTPTLDTVVTLYIVTNLDYQASYTGHYVYFDDATITQ